MHKTKSNSKMSSRLARRPRKRGVIVADATPPNADSDNHKLGRRWQQLLPELMVERLDKVTERRGCSLAWLIEKMLSDWLERRPHEWKGSTLPVGITGGAPVSAGAARKLDRL